MFEFVPKEADEEVSSHLDTESLEEIKKDLAQAIHGERHFFQCSYMSPTSVREYLIIVLPLI